MGPWEVNNYTYTIPRENKMSYVNIDIGVFELCIYEQNQIESYNNYATLCVNNITIVLC